MRALAVRRPEQRWVFFGLSALTIMMFSIDMTIVSIALRAIVVDLDTSLALAGWVLTTSALAQTIVMPLAGKLAEQFGQMRVFVVCVALFTVGSLLCGLAPNIYVLIAFRAVQAIGGGGFMPSAAGIVASEFPERRGQMIGLFASIFPIGGIIGPNLGGLIVEHLSWREIFLVNVPTGLLVFALLVRYARTPMKAVARRSVDLLGSALFAASIIILLLDLTFVGRDPSFAATPLFWLLLVLSGTLMGLFVWQECRAPEPVLDLALVLRHPFGVVNLYNFLFGACVFGSFTFIPYFASVQYGMGPLESGAVLTPRSLMMIGFSTVTSLFLLQFGYRLLMVVGLGFIIAALLGLSQGWTVLTLGAFTLGTFPLLIIVNALSGIGMGLVMPSSNNAAIDLMPERAAILTGIRGMFRSTGGVIGTALIVLALELSTDKAAGLRLVFLILGLLLLLTIPLAFLMPDGRVARRQPDAPPSGTPAESPPAPREPAAA